MNQFYPHLFQPLKIKGVTFKNRIFSSPNMMCYMDGNGYPTAEMIGYYAEKARGGAALVTVGDTPVDRKHAATMPRSFNLSESALPYLSELAMAIHEHGAKASLELNHGGLTANPEANNGGNPIGPVEFVREDGVKVQAMDEEMMNAVADSYADGAEILKRAGFDMCLIHGAHGWLLHQFLSPRTNKRTDEYGGSLENRMRFPLMVIERIRQRVGNDFLIEFRMSGSECTEGGFGIEEAIEYAKMVDGKVDLIHVSAGLDCEPELAVITQPTIFLPHGVNVKYAEEIRKHVNTPVVTVGAISDPEMAEEILANGKADVVAFARALIADPHFPNKARKGKREEIRPCTRCLDCLALMHTHEHFQCAVNHTAGREVRYRNYISPAKDSRKILVVGGGPGGMKAAITAAERGHKVTLAEKTDSLGGLLKFTDKDDLKEDLRRLKNHLIYMVNKSNVEVLFNTEATPEYAQENGFDAVIVAVGSSPAKPPVPGLDLPKVKHATEIYDELDKVGHNVVVLGGGLVGCESGLFLARRGHDVTIVEMQENLAPEANWMHREGMMQAFAKDGVKFRTSLRVTRVENDGVYGIDSTGNEIFLPGDTVVYAFGMRPNTQLAETFADCAEDVSYIGDCVKARKVKEAMLEGWCASTYLA